MTFDPASIVAGFVAATVIIGGWLVMQLIDAQTEIAILSEARDRNADDYVAERTRRMLAENALGDAMRATVREAALHHDYPSEATRNDA